MEMRIVAAALVVAAIFSSAAEACSPLPKGECTEAVPLQPSAVLGTLSVGGDPVPWTIQRLQLPEGCGGQTTESLHLVSISSEINSDIELRAVRHELGHVLGLQHVSDPNSTMYAQDLFSPATLTSTAEVDQAIADWDGILKSTRQMQFAPSANVAPPFGAGDFTECKRVGDCP